LLFISVWTVSQTHDHYEPTEVIRVNPLDASKRKKTPGDDDSDVEFKQA
jgi:hypothetical protein